MRKILIFLLCLSLVCPVYARAERYVALTFDDGPSGRFTRELLDGLAQRGVQATFLLCGYRLQEYPELAQRIFDEGHEIGLHGFSHENMAKMTKKQVKKELSDTLRLLPEGCAPAFLRPPGGNCSSAVTAVAKELSLGILHWSVDPRDWASRDALLIQNTVVRTVRDGDVILLHDMSASSVEAALAIVDELTAQGFTFVTASQLAELRGVTIQPGHVYLRFDSCDK